MVRPKLERGAARAVTIFALVTPKEKAALVERAVELERSTSSVVRSAVLTFLSNHHHEHDEEATRG